MKKFFLLIALALLFTGAANAQGRITKFTKVTQTLTVDAGAHTPGTGPFGLLCLPEFPYQAVAVDMRGTPDGATVTMTGGANGSDRETLTAGGVDIECDAAAITAGCLLPVASAPQALTEFCAEVSGAGASTSVVVTIVGQ